MKGSATSEVLALEIGETYARAKLIPANSRDLPLLIKQTKKEFLGLLSTIVARALKKEPLNNYKMHTVQTFTRGYDVIVAGIIVREAEPL